MENPVRRYIEGLTRSEAFLPQIAHHRLLPAREAVYAPLARPWSRAVQEVLARRGISGLYTHQARAIDLLRSGRHVITATPTASGKSLIYHLPLIEAHLANPETRALYLFPLKALAQDQLASFRALTDHWPKEARPTGEVYDGDTKDWARRKIRLEPPTALFTNPEMLHLSLLPHNETWSALFASLDYVVVDEAHTWRGLTGSHMAQVFRRLLRVCERYGTRPRFVFSSATLGNPGQLAHDLTGLDVEVVTENGAPCGERHMMFVDPLQSPSTAAIQLLEAALAHNLRTIVYTPSRRMAELISLWAAEKSGPLRDRISPYRAGFLPEERRSIEARMASGELLAVISTSALELGIDIGALDVCILVGYPGTVTSFMQRGGRVGRACQESAVIFVAGEDALDRHFIRHPDDFFARGPEDAVLNPYNPVILERHLPCAAAEIPLGSGEAWLRAPQVAQAAQTLEARGELLRAADGSALFARRKNPQREIDLRSAGRSCAIQTADGKVIGAIDGFRAWRETHPGAVYLHRGRSYVVEKLDVPGATVTVAPGRPDYYTRVRSRKETDILEIVDARLIGQTVARLGRLRVTEHVSGYEKRAVRDGRLRGVTPLEAPPQIFETIGVWFDVPDAVRLAAEARYLHFMGSIHALEHATIGVLPLLVMTDRNDFGGISMPMHPQVAAPCVFVYDAMPGGAGLSAHAFAKMEALLAQVRATIADCPCEAGCPSCVHSPKCGSGNRPIDKAGALFVLDGLLAQGPRAFDRAAACQLAPPLEKAPPTLLSRATSFFLPGQASGHNGAPAAALPDQAEQAESAGAPQRQPGLAASQPDGSPSRKAAQAASQTLAAAGPDAAPASTPDVRPAAASPGIGPAAGSDQGRRAAVGDNYVVFDVETRRSAAEVGGWNRADQMGVSVAVLYDGREDAFFTYTQDELGEMIARMQSAGLVVGFNSRRFDYAVLSPFTTVDLARLPTLDLLDELYRRLGYRLSLNNVAAATLGAPKSADGLAALRWWKEGRIAEIARYCQDDVRLTRDLYRFGRDEGHLLFTDKSGRAVRAPVAW